MSICEDGQHLPSINSRNCLDQLVKEDPVPWGELVIGTYMYSLSLVLSFLGYKSLEVVSRHVDAYLHMTEIKKWDICAGNAIIKALGGKMTTLSNEVLDYSSEDTVNTKGVLATMEKHEFYLEKLKPFKL